MRFAEFYWFNERLDCILVVAKLAASGPFGAICSCYWLSSPFAQTSRQHNTRHLKSEKYGRYTESIQKIGNKSESESSCRLFIESWFRRNHCMQEKAPRVEKVKEELRRES